ncbi:unnamed protein product [Prunus armeniaca]|nr:hypothetical protein GBA52_005087 [Prunus armeniaca]
MVWNQQQMLAFIVNPKTMILVLVNFRTMQAFSFSSGPTSGEVHNSTAALCGQNKFNGSTFSNTTGMIASFVRGLSKLEVHVCTIIPLRALINVIPGTRKFDVHITT